MTDRLGALVRYFVLAAAVVLILAAMLAGMVWLQTGPIGVQGPVSAHLPDRPGWACQSCDKPWPCVTAQAELLAEHDEHLLPLAMYLSSQHAIAVGDIGEKVTAADLYRRFLGWIPGPS